ncbi:MAG TPA: outer membrane beta-barrel protein [Puia sp.]|nr:outer membrane beta-barrel protein [Puia sp.]
MEHLENDMDDLFQKAGELYPLKTSESDWESMLGKLNEDGLGNQKGAIKMNSRLIGNKRKWLSLLLLIPIGVGSILYFSNSGTKNLSATTKLQNLKNSHSGSAINEVARPREKGASLNAKLKNEITENKTNPESSKVKTKEHSETATTGNNQTNITEQSNNKNTKAPLSNRKLQNDYSRSSKTKTSFLEGEIINDNLALGETSGHNHELSQEKLAVKPLNLSVASRNEMISVEGSKLLATDSKPLDDLHVAGNSKKSNNAMSNKGFYTSLFGGPDLSSVKLQSVSQLGFSLGIMVGYHFNKRFAVETGLMWDKKYYYSSGEYFDKSGTRIPSNVNILNVDGSCNMFEIPLNFRYDFATSNNHGFYVKGGLSSYLMKKENYNMLLGHPGYERDSAYSYNNSSRDIFSILQLSGGYERSIGTNTSIWIEPYLKIPLQGIGIGNMPISSAGFYVGISYSFR